MSAHEWLRSFLGVVAGHPLLERLFFASLELAILAVAMALVIRALRIRSPRLVALLWLLVLAKPVASLAIGTPLHVMQFEVPAAETVEATVDETLPAEQVSRSSL